MTSPDSGDDEGEPDRRRRRDHDPSVDHELLEERVAVDVLSTRPAPVRRCGERLTSTTVADTAVTGNVICRARGFTTL
jgi:hypothetical protein